MASLYELKGNWNAVASMLYDCEVPEQTVIDTLESIEGEIEDKADSYAIVMKELDGDINAIKAEEERLKARRIALENRKKLMQSNLMEAMKTTGKTKFKTQLFSFGVQKNGGKRALLLDVEPDQLPHTLRTIQYVPNNDAIREFLGDQESCAFAHLAEQGEHLTIR